MLRLAVRVRRAHAELVLAELLELAPSGVEEVAVGEQVIEFAVYGAPGELPSVPELTAAADGALVEIHTTEIEDDWAERWRRFHKPVVIEGCVTVRPPWEAPGGTPIDLVIDPGRAFGTGAHPTTRLCLEMLLSVAPGDALLDLGCGSGVLAIAAAKLGFAPVLAVDNDSASLEATAHNALINEVAIDTRRCDLRRDPLPAARTVVANLLRPLLLDYVHRIDSPPACLIAGGLLAGECDELSAAFAARGLIETDRRTDGEWGALCAKS